MKPKRHIQTSNKSDTGRPTFDSADIYELESVKNQVIEDRYKPNNTSFEIKAYERMIAQIEEYQMQFVTSHYYLNGKFPEGTKEIISYIPKPEIHNHTKVEIGIEGWNELEIKIGITDVVFRNRNTNRNEFRLLKKLKWVKNHRVGILRTLASEPVLKHSSFISTSRNVKIPKWQSIRTAKNKVLNDLRSLFPDLPYDTAIEYDYSKKGYTTPIKITLLDADERVVALNEKLQRKALKRTGTTYSKPFNDNRDDKAMQEQIRKDNLQAYIEEQKIEQTDERQVLIDED